MAPAGKVFSLTSADDLKSLRRALREAVDNALAKHGLADKILGHVAGVQEHMRFAEFAVAFTARDDEGRPLTVERERFIEQAARLLKQYRLPIECLGGGVRGREDGAAIGWIAGLCVEEEGADLILVEENDETRDWVGIPASDIAARIRNFGLVPATARVGGRIA